MAYNEVQYQSNVSYYNVWKDIEDQSPRSINLLSKIYDYISYLFNTLFYGMETVELQRKKNSKNRRTPTTMEPQFFKY